MPALVLAAVLGVLPSGDPAALPDPPNVVLIVTDDQRTGTLAWMPSVRARLVSRGTSYIRTYVPTPTCCPSRASLLTGLLAPRTGVWTNDWAPPSGGDPIGGWPAFARNGMEERSLAVWLTPRYRTILVGKYLNHYDRAAEGYVPPGWDAWHAFDERNGRFYDYRLAHTDGSITTHGSDPADYSTDVLVGHALDEIRSTPEDEPLFLLFTPYAPHAPGTPAPRHVALPADLPAHEGPNVNESDVQDKPSWIAELSPVSDAAIHRARVMTFRSLRAVDQGVARILGVLRRSGRLSNTLVIFTSDNGASWGEHRIPVNDKFVPYEAQMRVPLVVRWDGKVEARRKDRRLALNVDIPATVRRVAGIRTGPLDGRSLLRPRRHRGFGLVAAEAPPTGANGISFGRPAYCGYRTGRAAYVLYASGDEELYDLRTDPLELDNIAADPAATVLRDRLRARADQHCDPRPPGF